MGSVWTFYIDGVRCSSCVHKLEQLSFEHHELTNTRYNSSKNILTTTASPTINPKTVIEWIEAKGFKAFFVEDSQFTENKHQDVQRTWLMRLAITFFFASNLMMFTIALYLGASDEWMRLFRWICGFLYLPILFYSAIPFYQNAWSALKDRRFSADLAIVIAFLWGSALSYFNLFRDNQEFYFDSTASFIFLILLARYFLYRAQNSIESQLNPSLLFKSDPLFEITKEDKKSLALYHQINKNDFVKIQKGQTLPVDIELLSEHALIDSSLFSGESFPQNFHKGEILKSGTILLSPQVSGLASGTFEESELFQIFEKVIQNRNQKTRAHTKAEIYSQYLLVTVSIISLALLFFFGLQNQWPEGFRRALALFTIACPCSLALGIPLASVMSLKRAMELGLFIKTPLFFEKLNTINGVLFDKTGTLTSGQMEFQLWDPPIQNKKYLSIILSMEKQSSHPIAKSMTRFLESQNIPCTQLDQIHETPGVGIEATMEATNEYNESHQTEYYSIRSLQHSDHANFTGFELHHNSKPILRAYFKDPLREESRIIVSWLQKQKLPIYLLSGDRKEVVYDIAHDLNLASENCFGGLSPQAKSEFIKSLQKSNSTYLMIGDGHNDALALSTANASIAVHGAAETSLNAADVYVQKGNLMKIIEVFRLRQFYNRLIKQNIGLSLIYNTIAGLMAILGFINPLTAAILMPINSLVVISATAMASLPNQKNKSNFAR